MIDVVSTVAAPAAVEAPAFVDGTDAQLPPVPPSIRLGICDSLTSVLGYLATSLEVGSRKTTPAFDCRFLDSETWGQP